MCYSAMVQEDYAKYVRNWGADVSIKEFFELYYKRREMGASIPKGMDANFINPKTDDERAIRALIDEYNAATATKLETELFSQKQRLNAATRALQVKTTKKATEDGRIATNKIDRAQVRLSDLRRTEPKPSDSRIYPGWYAPVLVMEGGRRVLRPMRYQCRPAGKPAFYDRRFPGTYNARRDNLGGYWKAQFGHTHGIMFADRFYENVEGPDGGNRVLEFVPRTHEPMLIACLWSQWTDPAGKEPDLLSFAAITDEPEPEVAAAGHDRTIINIKPEHVDAWLSPDPANLEALYAIFDDKRHPYYEHRQAA